MLIHEILLASSCATEYDLHTIHAHSLSLKAAYLHIFLRIPVNLVVIQLLPNQSQSFSHLLIPGYGLQSNCLSPPQYI